MAGYTAELTERLSVAGKVFTSTCLVTDSKQTATIDMGNFNRLTVLAAALGTKATNTVPHATVKILDSTATGSAVHTAIVAGTIMCQTAGYARYRYLEMDSEHICKNIAAPGTTLGRFVRVRIIYGTRGTQVAFVALGGDARYEPHSNTVTIA